MSHADRCGQGNLSVDLDYEKHACAIAAQVGCGPLGGLRLAPPQGDRFLGQNLL